jgi:hypothetical protein
MVEVYGIEEEVRAVVGTRTGIGSGQNTEINGGHVARVITWLTQN